ncbi:hypothetical protein ABT147_23665 [Streptomyces sp. NPDC001868]|uniref:hypothetical protein n=1 Tax=Streptomyces sp. NPDC001868 TaxID=3154401 RepID=UPI00332FD7C8
MSAPSRLPLEGQQGTPAGPLAAGPTAPQTTVGEPKGAARKGAPAAVRPDPQTVTITGIQPGLQVRLNPPVADWLCACGHHERARGRAAVIELTTRVRVGHCPHRATNVQEGRAAA